MEADFIINCSKCGSEDFQEVFPVRRLTLADCMRLRQNDRGRNCLRHRLMPVCGAAIWSSLSILPNGAPSGLDAHPPRDHLDTRS